MENKFGQATYGVINTGIFGSRIVAGIITGIRLTEDGTLYEISFGRDSWWTNTITSDKAELVAMMNIADLDKIKTTHGLKIKFEK